MEEDTGHQAYSQNGFAVLNALGGKDLEELQITQEEPNVEVLAARGEEATNKLPQEGMIEEFRDTFRANSASSCSEAAALGLRKSGRKVVATKEHNLRNRSRVASSIHVNSYMVTSRSDMLALHLMKMAANRSWADQCEDDDYPPKHGDDLGSNDCSFLEYKGIGQ